MNRKRQRLDRRVILASASPRRKEILELADRDHVVILLADPEVSVNRFFDRPDREKQFLYKLLLSEDDPGERWKRRF